MNYSNTTYDGPSFEGHEDSHGEDEMEPYNVAGLEIIFIVNHVLLSGSICILGIVVNVINIVIFYRQGLSNTVNISMFAIAVSDLCSLVTLEWLNINLNPFMDNADVPFEPADIQYLTGGWPHACFLQITIWITVYVTAERFVCIALPLKVKNIFTPLRTKVVVSLIYLLMFIALAPEYASMHFGDNFYPHRNETRLGLQVRENTENIDGIVFSLFSVMGIVSFIILILFTAMLVITMNRRLKWRNESTADKEKSQKTSKRDKKTMKMVGLIAGILIICAAPGMFLSFVVIAVPGFDIVGVYVNYLHAAWSFSFLAEAINSTVNIFFFYKMSSKFRITFLAMFLKCRTCGRGVPAFGGERSSTRQGTPSVTSGVEGAENKSSGHGDADSGSSLPS